MPVYYPPASGIPPSHNATPTKGPEETLFPNRQYVSTDCLTRLDAFRFRPSSRPETMFRTSTGTVVRDGVHQAHSSPTGHSGEKEDIAEEEEDCVLTDYGSTSMFDDEPWFADDTGYEDNAQYEPAAPQPGSSGVHADVVESDIDLPAVQERLSKWDSPATRTGTNGHERTSTTTGQPFLEEGFFSDERNPTQEKIPNLVTDKNEEERPQIVRCTASDVSRNGKVRSVNITRLSFTPNPSPAWLLPGSGGGRTREPIQRPEFPAVVTQRPSIYGLSNKLTVKTCFRVHEALEVGSMMEGKQLKGDVLVELYAKVLSCSLATTATRQDFQFGDIFRPGPPFLDGEYRLLEGCDMRDRGPQIFEVDARRGKMARAVGRMTKRSNGIGGGKWMFQIQNIREADWDDIEWVESIICGKGARGKRR